MRSCRAERHGFACKSDDASGIGQLGVEVIKYVGLRKHNGWDRQSLDKSAAPVAEQTTTDINVFKVN
jgi:hypothetical protein